MTATTITIGIEYVSDTAQANAAAGAAGITNGDPNATARTLVEDINRRGGVAGRRLVALFYPVAGNSTTPYAVQAAAECAHFTQDNKVFMVLSGFPLVGALARDCLEKAGVLHSLDLTTGTTASDYRKYLLEMDPTTFRLDRLFGHLLPELAAQGWFAPWDKLTGAPGPLDSSTASGATTACASTAAAPASATPARGATPDPTPA